MDRAEVLAGRGVVRRAAHVDLGGEGRGEVGAADPGERVGDGRVRPQDDRLGRHQAAGRVLLVRHQAAYVRRLGGLHQVEEAFLVVLGEFGEEVGRVVRVHGLQDVGRALLLQLAEDLDLVVLRELFEDVGQAVVVEGGGDLGPALGGEVVQDVGEVGGAQLLEGGQEALRALSLLLQGETGDAGPVHGQRLALGPSEGSAGPALADEDAVDLPVPAGRQVLHRQVEDGDLLTGLDEGDAPVQEFAEHQPLGGALLEAAHVQHAGGDDLSGLDAGDAGHREEDPAPGGEFDDEAEQPRGTPADAEHGDEVADAAHLVAVRVEDGDTGEVRHEDSGSARCHGRTSILSCVYRGTCCLPDVPNCLLGWASG